MKKLNKIQKIAITALLAFAVAVPVVVAQSTDTGVQKERRAHRGEHRDGGRRGGDRMMGFSFRGLDLTDAQKAQVKQIHESHRQNLQPLVEAIRAKRQELRQANTGSTFNEAQVSQKLAEIAPLEAKLMGEQFRIRQEMLNLLTPEQKAKMEQTRDKFKSRSTERRTRKQQKTE